MGIDLTATDSKGRSGSTVRMTNDMKDSYKEVPQTPLGPGGVVHSPRLSKKAAFSLTEPDQNALRLVSGGASFCSLASLSPLPEAKAEAEPTADEAAGAEVCAEGVGLSCWADWRPRLLQEDCCWPEERYCARDCVALPCANWNEVSVCEGERKGEWVVHGLVVTTECEADLVVFIWSSLVCFDICGSLEALDSTGDAFCCRNPGDVLTVCAWLLLWFVSADGCFAACTVCVRTCVKVSVGFVGCACACGRAEDCMFACKFPAKSLGNLLMKSCWRLLVFSMARAIQDTSDEVACGAGWGSRSVASASFRFAGVVWTSDVSLANGALCLTGGEKPDGVWSKGDTQIC